MADAKPHGSSRLFWPLVVGVLGSILFLWLAGETLSKFFGLPPTSHLYAILGICVVGLFAVGRITDKHVADVENQDRKRPNLNRKDTDG